MRNLAALYEQGQLVEKNLAESPRWLRRAAEAGDAQALAEMGKACYMGWQTLTNRVEALFWLTPAVATNAPPPDLKVELGEAQPASLREASCLLREGELFASPQEKAEARARVAQFKARRPAQGSPRQ